MLVLTEVLNEARRVGLKCTPRTFWKYHSMELVPAGKKRGGRGNVPYFPDDMPVRTVGSVGAGSSHFTSWPRSVGANTLGWWRAQL